MTTFGELSVGSIVSLEVSGTPTNFIVVHQGLPSSDYDDSCNGTWLLMEGCYDKRYLDSTNNDYANSDVHTLLNNTFIDLFDDYTKSAIKQVKLPYTRGTGDGGVLSTGSSGISTKVFILSYAEAGFSGSTLANVEGTALSYFNGAADSKRTVILPTGARAAWWLRTPVLNSNRSQWRVGFTGASESNYNITVSCYTRPALILPSTFAPSSGAITGSVNIGGVQRELTGDGYINIGGVLHELSDSKVNIGGTLKSLKG